MARIVLVHGAFAGAWCWEPVLPGLRDAGHDVEAIDLPGSGEDSTPVDEVSLDAYARRICETVAAGAAPVVLVGHSMGGMAVTQAAARCPEQLAALVYVAAFAPAEGQSLMELVSYPEAAGDQVQANLVVAADAPVATLTGQGAINAVYNCCTPEQAEWGQRQHRPQALAPFEDRVSVPEGRREAFARLPRAYVVCTQDRAIPPAMQRRMLSDRGCDQVLELDTDHSPYVSRTGELVAALNEIVEALAPAPAQRPH
jgi:pimeloyl-ACP methyl ester carboxylesterase